MKTTIPIHSREGEAAEGGELSFVVSPATRQLHAAASAGYQNNAN